MKRKAALPPNEHLEDEFNRVYRYEPRTGKVYWAIGDRTHRMGQEAGSVDRCGYRTVCVAGHRIKLHRMLWLINHGSLPDGLIDHINGDKDDNRVDNLRLATAAQNVHNRIRSGKLKPGVYKGTKGRYVARIQMPGLPSKIYLGYYDTEAEAAAAYAGASIVLHGEYSTKLSRAA